MTTAISLAKLIPSDLNVRVSKTDDASIEALAENIAANGLLQSLVVIPQGKNFGVVAGARRLAALKLLVETKRMKKDASVPCLLMDGDHAVEASLAENYMREKMTPCDIYRAFATIPGANDTELAKRFGLTVDTVRRTKRLGNLHPTIFAAYAAGEINDQSAQAYAATTDTDRQLAAFEAMDKLPKYERYASAIKKVLGLNDGDTSAKLRFVGVDTYEAAGGIFERDLFETHDAGAGRIDNVELLNSLYVEKIVALHSTSPYALVPLAFEPPRNEQGYIRHDLVVRPTSEISDEATIRRTEIEAALEEGCEDDDAIEALEAELDSIEASATMSFPTGELITVPTLCYDGSVDFDVYRTEAKVEKPAKEDARASDEGEEEGRPAFTNRATDYIRGLRQHLLVVAATDAPTDHQDALLFIQAISQRTFPKGLKWAHRVNDTLTFTQAQWFINQDFAEFQQITHDEKQRVACDLLRGMIEPSDIGADTFPVQQFGLVAEVNARSYWVPDAEFFDLFKKQQLVDMLHDIDAEQAAMLVNMKVADAKARALKLVTAPDQIGGVTPEVQAKALAWVPEFLRFNRKD